MSILTVTLKEKLSSLSEIKRIEDYALQLFKEQEPELVSRAKLNSKGVRYYMMVLDDGLLLTYDTKEKRFISIEYVDSKGKDHTIQL